jgi:hypothetical protein
MSFRLTLTLAPLLVLATGAGTSVRAQASEAPRPAWRAVMAWSRSPPICKARRASLMRPHPGATCGSTSSGRRRGEGRRRRSSSSAAAGGEATWPRSRTRRRRSRLGAVDLRQTVETYLGQSDVLPAEPHPEILQAALDEYQTLLSDAKSALGCLIERTARVQKAGIETPWGQWTAKGNAFRTAYGFVARIGRRAKLAPRIHFYERRTYSGRPSSSMRFSDATAMATSVVCRPSVRERSASPITRL